MKGKHTVTEKIQCIKHTLKLLTTLTLSLVVILIVTLSGSPFDCDCLVALLSVTLPGSRVCIVVRWYKKYIMYVSYDMLCYVQLHALCSVTCYFTYVALCYVAYIMLHM